MAAAHPAREHGAVKCPLPHLDIPTTVVSQGCQSVSLTLGVWNRAGRDSMERW